MDTMTLAQIEAKLREAKTEYYNTGVQILDDDEYTTLEDMLRAIDPENALLSETGAEVTVSAERKVKHEIPMGSLAKAQIAEEAEVADLKSRFFGKSNPVASYKMDGCSVELVYHVTLKKAITRGNGDEGCLIINPEKIDGVLPEIDVQTKTNVRGEVYLTIDNFNAVNLIREKSGEKLFVNARNAVSGILNREDDSLNGFLSFKAFDIISDTQFETKIQKFEALIALGFDVPWFKLVTWDEFMSIAKDLNDNRKQLPYLIDGMVLDINDVDEFESLGVTVNKPKGAMALKLDPISAATTSETIVWQVGSTGAVTPVLEFTPVFVDGSTIARASIHNYTIFLSLGLGKGDVITVHKANDIIPQLKNIITKSAEPRFVAPTVCPVCGCTLSLITRGITELVCTNKSCAAQLEGSISKWVEKAGMKSKGIGDSFIKTFAVNHLVHELYDLTVQDIMAMSSSYKERSATKIYDAIQSSKVLSIYDFFGGLNGTGCGSRTFKKVIDHYMFKTIDEVIAGVKTLPLSEVEGIGDITAEYMKETIVNNIALIEELKSRVSIKVQAESKGSFVFTGSFETINPNTGKNYKRDDLKVLAEAKGFTTEDTVKKGVTYLVQSDSNSVSSKSEKAKKLGLQIINEEIFFSIINN